MKVHAPSSHHGERPQVVEADNLIRYRSGMSVTGFIAGLLGRGNRMRVSETLLHHIDGTGTGFEVDDLMSWSPTAEQEETAIAPLLNIHHRHRSDEYPIGTQNPASLAEIRALAEHLRAKGL